MWRFGSRDGGKLAASQRARRWLALLSLATFTFLVVGYLWWAKFEYHHTEYLAAVFAGALLLTLGNHWLQGDTFRKTGWRLDNLGQATAWYGFTTLALCLLIAAAGTLFGRFNPQALGGIAAYLPWAALQQHLLQNFLKLRAAEVLGEAPRKAWVACLIAAALFALFHLPNPVLTASAFGGGLLWCLLYTKHPNFPWAVISQTLVTGALLLFFKYAPLNQFEVGLAGYRYDYYGTGAKVAAGYDDRGQPYVATLPGPDRGVAAEVRLFDTQGNPQAHWVAFPELDFSGEIAVGDLGYGPGDEIVVAAGPGRRNPPRVRVFDQRGNLLVDFLAEDVGDAGFGAWVSARCGRIYVGAGPAPAAPPLLAEYAFDGRLLRSWSFSDLGLVNGVRGTGLCRRGEDREPAQIVVWGSDIAVNPSTVFLADTATSESRPIETLRTTFGAQVALLEVVGQTVFALAPGPLRGYPPLVAVTDFEGNRLSEFSAFGDRDNHGANLAAIDTDGDGVDELVLGQGIGPGRPPRVWVFTTRGELRTSWEIPSSPDISYSPGS